MRSHFDDAPERSGTDSVKYDLRKEFFGEADILPMWVADMDFPSPDYILNALRSRIDHGVFGYSFRPDRYYDSIISWMQERHNWKVMKEWICFSPGIVPALNLSVLAFTKPGDSIIVQPPVYFPFFSAVESHGRKLIFNPLKNSDGRWEMDITDLEKLAATKPAMIILSNPHNPVGRSWSPAELEELVSFCLENRILILSDEIHCDLVMPGFKHQPVASLSNDAAEITVTCISPSKTFNLAGLYTSSVIIRNESLRKSYNDLTGNLHLTGGNIFGTEAAVAAYSNGGEWVDELTEYINGNAMYVSDYCMNLVPEIIPARLEATYLMWLDCRKLGMEGKEMGSFFVRKAGVGMNEGSTFGPGGEGYMRMNIACPRKTVKKAMHMIERAISNNRRI